MKKLIAVLILLILIILVGVIYLMVQLQSPARTDSVVEPTPSHSPVNESTEVDLSSRALVIVVENNNSISSEFISMYEQNREIANEFFPFLKDVDDADLEGLALPEIIDEYGEDWLGEQLAATASEYGEVIVLSDEQSTFSNFSQTLRDLNKQDVTIDILLSLHGGTNSLYFYDESISTETITDTLAQYDLNLGYVYQTLCTSSRTMESWIEIGAQVSNGSAENNNYVILAPEEFLDAVVAGKSFESAVNQGYWKEINYIKLLSVSVPALSSWVDAEHVADSKPIFAGDGEYVLE